MHAKWLASTALAVPVANLEVRFRYNPDVHSLVAMVPAVIPMLLLLIPAMLTTLSVVREKELGSLVNFYVTPVSRLEFLVGKQLPYVVLGMVNFLLLTLLAVTVVRCALQGQFRRAGRAARFSTSSPPRPSVSCSRPSCAANRPRSSARPSAR